jgi:hypothetical protein
MPGVPETSQVARIKNTHYDNIVHDLLGVTTLANGEPPSSLLNTDSIGAMNTYMWEAYQTAATNIAAKSWQATCVATSSPATQPWMAASSKPSSASDARPSAGP